MNENDTVAKTASVVGAATLLSRVGGLVRDQVTAYFFGASQVADAFFVAWRLPNLLRRLLAEGALTAAFVPVFTDILGRKGSEGAAFFFRNIFTLMFIILLAATLLGVVFAPQLVMLIAPGFADEPGQFALTVMLTRMLFPYILLMGLTSLFMGALNCLGVFAAPALGPFLGNLGMIAGSVFLSARLEPPVAGLALGALAGGLAQLFIQWPYLAKAGRYLGFSFQFSDPALKRTLLLMGPAALGAAVYQVSVFVNTLLASLLPEGSISWLYYADRLMQFPLGIFAAALGTAALPALSRQSAAGDRDGFLETARFSLGLSFFVTLPAAMGLAVLAEPLISLLFQHGRFDAKSAAGAALALRGYALGLPMLSGASLLAKVCYSRGDTKTPTLAAAGSLAAGAALAFVLMWPLAHLGLALASSLASAINLVWLYLLFIRRERNFPTGRLLREVGGYLAWSVLMGALLWPLSAWSAGLGGVKLLAASLLGVAGGAGLYFAQALFFKCPHLAAMVKLARRRRGRA